MSTARFDLTELRGHISDLNLIQFKEISLYFQFGEFRCSEFNY